jgi:hypothetical protein
MNGKITCRNRDLRWGLPKISLQVLTGFIIVQYIMNILTRIRTINMQNQYLFQNVFKNFDSTRFKTAENK